MGKFFGRKYKIILLILALFAIGLLSASLLGINYFNSDNTTGNQGLKEYASFKAKFNSLDLKKDPLYPDIISEISALENKTTSSENRYKALAKISLLLNTAYSKSLNPKIFDFIKNDTVTLAKEKFKDQYKEVDFVVICQDPHCADSPIPEGINTIINEINSLENISDAHKEMMILNLKYDSYLPSENIAFKARSFLGTAYDIRNDKQFADAGANDKIADEIEKFVKDVYPKYYIDLNEE